MQAPKRLSKEARAKWAELEASVDLSSPFGVELLAQYCEQWAVYCTAMAEVGAHVAQTGCATMTHNNGEVGEHPAITTAKTASVQMRQLLKHLTLKDADAAEW